MYALFDRLGYGRKDFSAVLQLLRGQLDDAWHKLSVIGFGASLPGVQRATA